MRTINVPLQSFPKINEQFIDIPEGSTIGVANNSRLFYKKNADFLTSSFDRKTAPKKLIEWGIPPEKIIMTWFMWDNILNRFKSSSTYIEYLQAALSVGVNKCVQMDFSIWYEDPEPIQVHNLYFNFVRLRQAQELGFQTILNFNNILVKYEEIYRKILPENVHTVWVDENHSEQKYQITEYQSLEMLLDICKVKHFIFQTGKKQLPHRKKFLYLLKQHGIRYTILPTELKIFNELQKLHKNTAVNSV
jgi:hypothetical protein